jgi:hypothetical protein
LQCNDGLIAAPEVRFLTHNPRTNRLAAFALAIERRGLTIGPIICLAFFARLASIILLKRYINPQTWEFAALARNMAQGRGYSDLVGNGNYIPSVYMPPAYPYLLSLFFRWFGVESRTAYLMIDLVQALAGVMLVYLVFHLALLLFDRGAAILAAAIAAIYPPFVYMCNEVHGINLYIVIGVAIVFYLVRFLRLSRSWRDIIAAGSCMGVMMLFRGESPALMLVYVLVFLLVGGRRVLVQAAVFVLIAVCILSPWTARNYREFGRVIPVCESSGVNLWIGNNPSAMGSDRYPQADAVRTALIKDLSDPVTRLDPQLYALPGDIRIAFSVIPMDRYVQPSKDRVLKNIALGYIATHPQQTVRLAMKKMLIFFLFDPNHEKGRKPEYWVPSVLLALAAVVGGARAGKQLLASNQLFLVVSVLFAVLLGAAIFVLPRYRIVIDPFMILLATNLFCFQGAEVHKVEYDMSAAVQ